MRRFTVKGFALFMAFVFVLALTPQVRSFADSQENVSSLFISKQPAGVQPAGTYGMRFTWGAAPAGSQHGPLGYYTAYRNTTSGVSNWERDTPAIASPTPTDRTYNTLTKGSLYEFTVQAYHTHTDNNGNTTPVFASGAHDNTAFLITDLDVKVDSAGIGKRVVVTWDNPRYLGNREIIPGWQINYTIGPIGTNIPDDSKEHNIPTGSPSLTAVEGGRKLQYTFEDPKFEYGTIYSLKVQPTIAANGAPLPINGGQVSVDLSGNGVMTSKYFYTSGRDFSTTFYLEPGVEVADSGTEHIRISWDSLESSPNGDISAVIVEYKTIGDLTTMWTELGRIIGSSAAAITHFWTTVKPQRDTEYRIRIIYTEINPETGNPYEVVSQTAVYSPTSVAFVDYSPTIYELNYTNALTWKFLAFMREPQNDNEPPNPAYNGKYIDLNVSYDIWVADSLALLNSAGLAPIMENLPAGSFNLSPYTGSPYDPTYPVPVFSTSVTQYMSADGLKNIEENKVYYIKIAGTRTNAQGDKIEEDNQAFAYAAIYIPPVDDISGQPIMLAAPPLKVTNVADTAITIEWETKYKEIYNHDTGRWYYYDQQAPSAEAEAAIGSGPVVTRDIDISMYDFLLHCETNANILAAASSYTNYIWNVLLGYTGSPPAFPPLAYPGTDLTDPSTWPNLNDNVNNMWTYITPVKSGTTLTYTVSGLTPNTPYVIFLRPYLQGKNASYYPAYVSETTINTYEELHPHPISPIIEIIPGKTTDTSIDVRFTYVDGLKYTLYYSTIEQEWKTNGGPETKERPHEIIIDTSKAETRTNPETGREQLYMPYTLDGLFPDTTYHIWVTAHSEYHNETRKSNPVTETTLDLEPPNPPRGFGPASQNSLDTYNTENGTDYTPFSEEYLIYQWMRYFPDASTTTDYTVIDADLSANNDKAEALFSANLATYYFAKFNELSPNRRYYARARTILTVTKDADGDLVRSYSYEVQISEEEDFRNAVSIIIPITEGEPARGKLIRKYSVWTETIGVFTNQGGDYDGFVNEKHYPLPNKNYEMLYDETTKHLTYRFRANDKDAEGHNDNQVDRRFISDLVRGGDFVYDIDLSSYGDKEISIREVLIPYSIIKAFDERKISIRVITADAAVTLRPGAFDTSELKNVEGLGTAVRYSIKLTDAGKYPPLDPKQTYANNPQTLSLSVITPSRTVNMTQTGSDMNIQLRVSNRYLTMDANVGAYFANSNTGGWLRMQGKYNEVTAQISTTSRLPGGFAVISAQVPIIADTADYAAVDAIYKLTTKLNITDLMAVDPADTIHANQFNQLILALSKGQTSVAFNNPLTQAQIEELGKAGMLVSGSGVPLQNGVNAIMRLYENKAGRVRSYPKASESKFAGIAEAQAQYQTALLKAEEAGMLERFNDIDPQANMTFADVLYMLDIFIDDAGL